ncbi:Type III restriction-modification system methylation subunit (EC [uncultured Gammaproteobacteria bacterium]|nr:Type III restriction-modification system methylation subunit (EC [uncultured Gammaproteobacteria bacterium]
MKFNQQLEQLLKTLSQFTDAEGELLKQNVKHSAEKFDPELIKLLLNDPDSKAHFFDEIDTATIFNYRKFIDYIDDKNFLIDSYTKFSNKVGLTLSNKHIQQINEVVLSFPFKDCVLEGGQSKDDEKRKEIFFNEVLAKDEINRLLNKKVITSAKKYTQNGVSDKVNFNRNENGLIKDNLIIKGNNLLALHTLKSNFAGKVKLIYIDPPYNTGNDSFNYNDNFNHSTWLTFMKNRLEVARDLLSEDGVIFVQCDDNEQAYLKVLMDEIFERECFIEVITVVNNPRGRDYGGVANMHEFITIFGKTSNYRIHHLVDAKKEFPFKDKTSGFEIRELRNRNTKFNNKNRPNLCYPFYLNTKKQDVNGFYEISLNENKGWVKVMPLISQGIQTVWRWGKEKSQNNMNINICGKAMQENGKYQIIEKYRKKTRMARSVWWDKEVNSERGTLHLKKLFENKVFDNPKPEETLNRVIEMATKKGDIVLDYHLGSGTTCAVAHKMGRQYIGIEQMDYIEDIAVKRMQKVIGTTVRKDGELLDSVAFDGGGISKSVEWQGGGEFIYFELDKYNQKYIDKLNAIKQGHGTAKTIEQLYDEITKHAFLNYDVESEKLLASKKDFEKLSLTNQLEFLFSILNKNQLYKNLAEIDDKDLTVDEKTKHLNNDFYHE